MNNTVAEAGIIWSKTSTGLELGGAGVSKYADARLKNSAINTTVAVVAAGLEFGTTYYFRSYVINNEGAVGYSDYRTSTTRADRSPVFGQVYNWGSGNSRMYYAGNQRTANPEYFTATQIASIDTLAQAFADDGFTWYNQQLVFTFQIRGTASGAGNNIGDTLLLCRLQYTGDGVTDGRAYFGWRASCDAARGILTLKDFIYSPTFQNAGTSYASDLMSKPHIGPALLKYFDGLTGTTAVPRRILIDHQGYDTWGNPYMIMMPLDEVRNPNFNYSKWRIATSTSTQHPIW
jgi:hypothetical protein